MQSFGASSLAVQRQKGKDKRERRVYGGGAAISTNGPQPAANNKWITIVRALKEADATRCARALIHEIAFSVIPGVSKPQTAEIAPRLYFSLGKVRLRGVSGGFVHETQGFGASSPAAGVLLTKCRVSAQVRWRCKGKRGKTKGKDGYTAAERRSAQMDLNPQQTREDKRGRTLEGQKGTYLMSCQLPQSRV